MNTNKIVSDPLIDLEQRYEKLRYVVGLIAFDGVELSHEKIQAQRDYYQKICKEAWYTVHNYDPDQSSFLGDLDDRF